MGNRDGAAGFGINKIYEWQTVNGPRDVRGFLPTSKQIRLLYPRDGARKIARVRTGVARGQDPADLLRLLGGRGACETWRGKARNLRLSRLRAACTPLRRQDPREESVPRVRNESVR